jgi:hypothetical protein
MGAEGAQPRVAVLFVIAPHYAEESERKWRHGHQRAQSHHQVSGGADLDRTIRSRLEKVRARDRSRELLILWTTEESIANGSKQTVAFPVE